MEFVRQMNRDSVANAVSFDPALSDLSFSWNGASTKAVVTASGMSPSTEYTVTLSTVATDAYGVPFAEPAAFSFTTAAPVSVENRASGGVVIYPNPASEKLFIKGMDVASVTIHNLTGRLVKSTDHSREIDLGDMKPGSYFVTVSDREANSVRKLIVIQ